MSDPIIRSFFFGRALGSTIREKIEDTLTDALSEISKFDAEQRERLRKFVSEVQARAERDAAKGSGGNSTNPSVSNPADLQEDLDELRAEIARLRAELKHYRNQPQ